MPRIDPLQLLKCLSVLLSPTGGIKSKDEVQRLASLMTKFSKKLVSKCIYIQILKSTKTDLLGMFMGAGGWNLTNTWLSDAIVAKNWPLIQELLELLLMCPVDVERLKINNCPKLIKGLSKDSSNESVKLLASKLVEQWLKIVKGETEAVRAQHGLPPTTVPAVTVKAESPESQEVNSVVKLGNLDPKVEIEKLVLKPKEENVENVGEGNQLPVYKITMKDGKRVLAKVESADKASGLKEESEVMDRTDSEKTSSSVVETVQFKTEDIKKEPEEMPVKVNSEPNRTVGLKSKVKVEKLENNVDAQNPVKENIKKSKDSSSKLDKDKKSSKEKSRDKDRSKDKLKDSKSRDKDKDSSKVKDKKLNSDKSSDKGDGISEKDRATLAKLIPPAISKLGKIPKKPKTEEVPKPASTPTTEGKKTSAPEVRKPAPAPEPVVTKKPSISIESRKLGEPGNRPKTVKTFNSKFRSTGLEEEAKPPPSRQGKKAVLPLPMEKKQPLPPPLPAKLPSLKRPSPPRDSSTPPEKKMKPAGAEGLADEAKKEKSGGIKLIPPRPKPSFLQESDMFMDALTASTKKEPRKRKRRISSSKDGPESKKDAPPPAKEEENKDSTPPSSPQNNGEKSPPIMRPLLKFYQDTLETNEEEKEESNGTKEIEKMDESEDNLERKTNAEEEVEKPPTPTEDELEDKLPKTGGEDTEEQQRRSSSDDASKDEESSSSKETSSTEAGNRYPKGVLIYHKSKKGPKKVVRWKQEKDLETIRYFELDETERVNVTKNFMDMKQMERTNEREAFLLARKLAQDDIMEEKTGWQPLIPIDLPPSLVEPGSRSQEKEVQYAREKVILQAIYFSRSMIPDTPAEPDLEIHPSINATIIPLEDITGNPDSVNDFQNTPWPEPKPILIPQSPPPQFQQPQPPFNQFPNQQNFQGGPPMFQNQGNMPNNMPMPPNSLGPMNMPPSGGGDWRTGDGKVLPLNDIPPMPMDMYNQGGPPMGMGMGMPGMGGPEMNFNMMGDDMGPPGGPYPGQGYPMGGPPPNMFPYRGGGGGGGGSNNRDMRRGRGRGPNNSWHNNSGPHNWQGRGGRGSGGRSGWGGPQKGVCKHFRNGFCKHGEACPFLHPGMNGPMY